MKRIWILTAAVLLLTACSGKGALNVPPGKASDPTYFESLWSNLAGQLKLDPAKPILLRQFTLALSPDGVIQSAQWEFKATDQGGQVRQMTLTVASGRWQTAEVPSQGAPPEFAVGQVVFQRLDKFGWSNLLSRLGRSDRIQIKLKPEQRCQVMVTGQKADASTSPVLIDTCRPALG